MAETEPGVEVYSGVSKLQRAIEETGKKIDEMMAFAKREKNMRALLIEARVQSNNLGGLMKRFDSFTKQFCEFYGYRSVGVITSSDDGFKELKETVEEFREEMLANQERVGVLFVKFGELKGSEWTAVVQDEGKDEPRFVDMSIKGIKVGEDVKVVNLGMEDMKIHDDYVKCAESSVLGFDDKEDCVDVGEKLEELEGEEGRDEFEEVEVDDEMRRATGPEAKMRECVLKEEGREIVSNKYKEQGIEMKSLMNWIKESETADKKWIEIKTQAVELGADICHMVGDLMYRLSERDEVIKKFHEYKSALESLSSENSSTMITMLINALDVSFGEIKERESMRLTKKRIELGSSSGKNTSESDMNQLGQIHIKIFSEACRLESIMNKPGLPDPKVATPTESDFKQFEKAVKGVGKEVKKLKDKASSIYTSEVLNFDINRRKVLEFKIKTQWD